MIHGFKQYFFEHQENIIFKNAYILYRKVVDFLLDIISAIHLIKIKTKRKEKKFPIKVCFVQQDANCWNKSKALYNLMLSDKRFSVSLLCVPDPFDSNTGSTYQYFKENGYDAIDTRIGEGPWNTIENTGEWFDLYGLNPDYVFYQQPYDDYLPSLYKSTTVSKYTKICITNYGFVLIKELLECLKRQFYRNVYCMYAVSETEKNYNYKRFYISHKLGIRKSNYFGTLVFADFLMQKDQKSESWEFSKNEFRVIWTPRWSTDKKIGGSNFLRYKDFLPKYAEDNPDVDVLFRPHPMTFDNFIKTGEMTAEEVADFIKKRNDCHNTSMDNSKEYGATFWQSSVLLTDISAVIIEYFVTGKPIIFCTSNNADITYLDFFNKMLSVCYVATNKSDIAMYLEQLKTGNDPLKSKREDMIKNIFGEDLPQTPSRIVNDIVEDFKK